MTNGARKLNTGSDHSRFQSASCRNSIIMNSVNGSKSALIPRILQNVSGESGQIARKAVKIMCVEYLNVC